MQERSNMYKIFFAIPCGEFFFKQREIIEEICGVTGIKPVIIESHHQTSALWNKITKGIDDSDFFVADISSLSSNVVVELGYALHAKEMKNLSIFVSNVTKVPVDLQGFVLHKYGSFREFREQLIDWILGKLRHPNNIENLKAMKNRIVEVSFREDFKDFEMVRQSWRFPLLCSWNLTHKGLRFTNAHMPILATSLSLLQNHEFKFQGKIERENIGWVVKGTQALDKFRPSFCVMFQLTSSGYLVPHIFNENNIDLKNDYHVFEPRPISIEISVESLFEIITRVNDDRITILDNTRNVLFDEDFTQEPFGQIYNNFDNKQGAIGFRCHPKEEAVVSYVEVKEL